LRRCRPRREPGELHRRATVRHGPIRADPIPPSRYLEVIQQFACAGFDHLVMQNAGPDPDGFIDFQQRELHDRMRESSPQS
jgi:hypothetical protein